MQQIYRRTPIPKYDFNKVAKAYRKNRTRDSELRTPDPYVGSGLGTLHLAPFTWHP